MRRAGLVAVVLAVVQAMASPALTGASSRSGLFGVVLAGPTKPVCRVAEPCEKPIRVTLVFSQLTTGEEEARTRSRLDGRYRLVLPAGNYKVRTVERIGIDRNLTPRRVHVRAGRFDRIVFRIDTGIR